MMKRKIFARALLILLAISLCSCAAGYKEDKSCAELAEAVKKADGGDYERYGDDYLTLFFDGGKLCDDYEIIYSSAVEDVDELGIFRLSHDGEIGELSALLEKYLDDMLEGKRAFVASYAPHEVRKLEDAEVRVYGRYAVYAIMDTDARESAFSEIEKELKK